MKIEDAIQSKFDTSILKALVNLKYTSNWLSGIQNEFMSEFDLSMAQFNILRILRGAKGAISVNTVKERMIEVSPNSTRLMDKLLDKKLIERRRCEEDRRVVYVEISKGGLKLLSKIDRAMEEKDLMPKSLTEKEAETLSDLLDKLRDL